MSELITALSLVYVPVIGWLIWENKKRKEHINKIEDDLNRKKDELANERIRYNELKALVKRLISWVRWFRDQALETSERSYRKQKPISRRDYQRLRDNKAVDDILDNKEWT